MFTGIIEEIGVVTQVTPLDDGARWRIRAPQTCADAEIGESIAVSGTCLTVTAFETDWFEVEAVAETLRRTRLGDLAQDSPVNLEKSLRLGDRLGGHLVTGHVDAVATLESISAEGVSSNLVFHLPSQWAPYFVEKGSVAVDGISLTVASCAATGVAPFWFRVALIPHTMQVTTLGKAKVGDRVNIETDIMARYVMRLMGAKEDKSDSPDLK